jgi:hypothetical protein
MRAAKEIAAVHTTSGRLMAQPSAALVKADARFL